MVNIPSDPIEHAKKVNYKRCHRDWPEMYEILFSPQFMFAQTSQQFAELIASTDEFKKIIKCESLSGAQQSKLLFFVCELFRLNKHLYNTSEAMKRQYNLLCDKLIKVNDLNDYFHNFDLDIREDYNKRLISKRNYIEFIFTHTELGPLIAKKIAQFYY